LPVAKAETVVGWSAAKEDHGSCDYETDDGEDLDGCKPEFGFPKERYSDDVQD
jgi:hypothetical protein